MYNNKTVLELLQLLILAVDEGDFIKAEIIRQTLPTLQVSFSGGRTSAYLCKLIKEYQIPAVFTFMNTGIEHPKTYEFIKKCNDKFDLNLNCIKGRFDTPLNSANYHEIQSIEDLKFDLSIWHEMMIKYSTPYFSGEFCTDRMKTGIVKKWQQAVFGKEIPVILGIRGDEPKRLNTKNPNVIHMGHLFPDVCKEDILDWWSQQEFDLEIPEYLGNCVFCIKKDVKKVALAIKDEPELYKQFSELLRSPDIRTAPNGRQQDIMYRGKLSLDGIAYLYDLQPKQELQKMISKEHDSNSCSESCEIQY